MWKPFSPSVPRCSPSASPGLAGRWRAPRAGARDVVRFAAAYATASAALAWGTAAGWNEAAFRAYYVFGGLLTAPLLGAGSLLLLGKRWVIPVVLVYAGLAVGAGSRSRFWVSSAARRFPRPSDHLDYFPVRILALVGNVAGTLAVVTVAVLSFRRRPLGMGLLLAGVTVAAVGSALAGLGPLRQLHSRHSASSFFTQVLRFPAEIHPRVAYSGALMC